MSENDATVHGDARFRFPPTRWSVVLRTRGEEEAEARQALEQLCRQYWYPLYAFVRRRGLGAEDAEDAVQLFFVRMLEGDLLAKAREEKGRLRSYLLGAMKNHLASRWREETAQKRGGGCEILTLDVAWAEEQLSLQRNDEEEGAYDRGWALSLVERVMVRLANYYESRNRGALFQALKPALLGEGDFGAVPGLGESLGLTAEGIRSAVFQMRKRFRRYVEEEIADTVNTEEEMKDELAYLCRILAGGAGN